MNKALLDTDIYSEVLKAVNEPDIQTDTKTFHFGDPLPPDFGS